MKRETITKSLLSSRKQLLEAMRKKRDCDSAALLLVESCLEPVESEEELLKKVRSVNPLVAQDL